MKELTDTGIELNSDLTHLVESIENLIEKAKQGDHKAFKQLVLLHEQQVMATVTGMLGDVSEARDVSQKVFISFYKSISNYRGDAKLGTYLTRIAINLSLNEIKRKKRKLSNLERYKSELGMNAIFDKSAEPEQMENRELVQMALQKLPEDARSVVVLRMIDGYSTKETAEMLNLPMGTIGSRLARAQNKLKEILKDLI